jgi:hypothetical protein
LHGVVFAILSPGRIKPGHDEGESGSEPRRPLLGARQNTFPDLGAAHAFAVAGVGS